MSTTAEELKAEWEVIDAEFTALDERWRETETLWRVAWEAYIVALQREQL